jgi:uncharacterized protein (DUF952 family)
MGFKLEINSILRSDEDYDLKRLSEHNFAKLGSRLFFDAIPIWLTRSDWTARAEICVITQTRTPESISGRFRVLHVYEGAERDVMTVAFRRMYAAGDDPLIYLLMSNQDFQRAQSSGVWDPPSRATEGFIHASPKHQLMRVANKHYGQFDELQIVLLQSQRLQSEIRWEPASGDLYPHVYGPINMNATVKSVSVKKGSDGAFTIDPARF